MPIKEDSQQRGTIGKIMSRDQFRAEQASIPEGTKLTFVRGPAVPHPSDLSLVLEWSPLPDGGMLLRGYAISASTAKLAQSTIALRRGEASWPMGGSVLRGRHGYFYRTLELRLDSANPGEFFFDAR